VIRLAWRQFRGQAAVAAGALAAVAIVSAASSVHSRYDSGLRTWLGVLVVVTPGVLGLFWGAPLVAGELEAGTFRLAWTQSVTRTRWLAARAGLAVLAGMAVAGVLSVIVT
jgi:ABC-type transport system involved in multi-copper enzyme maturation permease subunit